MALTPNPAVDPVRFALWTLRVCDPAWLGQFASLSVPEPHPLFQLGPGPVADWEVGRPDRTSRRTQQ